jgi:hypothetical protein
MRRNQALYPHVESPSGKVYKGEEATDSPLDRSRDTGIRNFHQVSADKLLSDVLTRNKIISGFIQVFPMEVLW